MNYHTEEWIMEKVREHYEEALQYLINHPCEIDIAVLELLLPRLDGVSLLDEIKNRNLKRKYIEMFCKKFNNLNVDISINHYVYDYLHYHKMEKLIDYINKCDISAIERIK